MRKDRLFSLFLIAVAVVMLAYPFRYKISLVTIDKIQPYLDDYIESENVFLASTRNVNQDYGLRSDDYDGILLYESKESTEVNEIMVVKVKNSAQREEVKKAMEKRIDKRIKIFEGYGPDQTALLKESRIRDKKGYVVLIISPNAETIWKDIAKVI
ncbi:DUF4358 domain-containing protein [Beduini massiliensis]|uniref:DUF4358 domain-containing protein n=1 Tax=Beduini massiliensis TaxID=1585974 RepID=UPI00059A9FD8|nr:DUF4358 domain-containing protein [Beduini massiliensis]